MLSKYLRELADNIDNNNCALTQEQELELLSLIAHQKLNKSLAANLLNISTRTFDRLIKNGIYPEGRKDYGSSQLYWYKDELLNHETDRY